MVVKGTDSSVGQLRRGVLEFCVMALLERGERYGFDLVKQLGSTDGLVIGEGTVYPLLSRLRREGLVETSWQESPSGPPRRYYRLSPAGEQALATFRLEWSKFRDTVDGVLKGAH